ncbi:MAG: hypothetical protein FWE41_08575, partial [Coriobacteriia bacterium]|nr:hypothetical protein [Coriobacteriia bacterium]
TSGVSTTWRLMSSAEGLMARAEAKSVMVDNARRLVHVSLYTSEAIIDITDDVTNMNYEHIDAMTILAEAVNKWVEDANTSLTEEEAERLKGIIKTLKDAKRSKRFSESPDERRANEDELNDLEDRVAALNKEIEEKDNFFFTPKEVKKLTSEVEQLEAQIEEIRKYLD